MTMSGVAVPLGAGCNCYRLTPAAAGQRGAIWSPNTINLNNDFDMTFQVSFGNGDVWAGDGMGFVLQQNASGIGSSGNGLGFAAPYGVPPISASNFIVEIDQFDNGGAIPTDHANDHVAMSINGSQHHTQVAATPFAGLQEIGDGLYHEVRITWDAGLQVIALYWQGAVVPLIAHNIDLINSVFAGNPNVYWGWTAGTGGVFGEYRVCTNSNAAFSQDLTSVCPGLPVQFTDGSTSDLNLIDAWDWDFGDGSPNGTVQDPTHSYNAPGNYTVTLTMTDGFGCDYVETSSVTVLDSITMNMSAVDVTCFGDTDGQATSSPTNGTGPYAYLWDDPSSQASQSATNLPPGWYLVEVTDNLGCVGYDSIEVMEPLLMVLTMDSTDASCNGGTDGTATATPINGSAPYGYVWSDGGSQTTQTASGLPAGVYSVVVTDVNGCTASDSIEVVEATGLEIALDSIPTTCFGGSDGAAIAVVVSGVGPFTYLWDDAASQTSASASNLPAGIYNVVVTSVNGCTANGSVVVNEPSALLGSTTIADDFGTGGQVDLTVSGGTSPYTYNWSNGETTQDLTNVSAGTYQVIITDNNGCTLTLSSSVSLLVDLDFPTAISPNNDGMNDTYVIIGIEGYPENSFTITNRWGNVVYSVENYSNTWGGENTAGEPLPEGVYFMVFESGIEQHTTYVEIRR